MRTSLFFVILQPMEFYFVINDENTKKLTGNYSDIHRDIIEQCKHGHSKAQYQLYKLYSKAMFNICYRMMNSREEAEDLLQESFSEAFQKLNYFRYESSFGAWLKRIVINKCINELRRKKTELVLTDKLYSVDRPETEPDENSLKLSVNAVQKAIEKLSDGYRVVFSLYMLEGYDHSEIAQILNISESTSKSQYMRAKLKLKSILAND